jgi:ATP-dependent 26S proteasome regulatory subunit
MRAGLFRMYLNNRPMEDDIDYAKLAAESGECNAADIPAICNEAAKLAWEDSIVSGVKRKISMEDMQKEPEEGDIQHEGMVPERQAAYGYRDKQESLF